jgi:ubiquinone/menaquinone biosynthesis C-methylase UbiE
MNSPSTLEDTSPLKKKRRLRWGLRAAIESKKHHRQSFSDYRRFVQHHYDGLAGELTHLTGILTGHAVLAGRVFRPTAFDIRGCKRILDAGCGNGRYTKCLLRQADPDAFITAFDLSQRMLRRARKHVRSGRVSLSAADVTRLPYPDEYFDCVVCGWMLEHLPDPRPGLRQLSRILRPGGKMLLMVTEDTVTGAMCSRMWHCRTYNRRELMRVCRECGLRWARPLYFTHLHRLFRLGGIIVELIKQ